MNNSLIWFPGEGLLISREVQRVLRVGAALRAERRRERCELLAQLERNRWFSRLGELSRV